MLKKFAAIGLLCVSVGAYSAATPDQVASLGNKLITPAGAERAGNAAGTIPAWRNGLAGLSPGNVSKQGLIDPFPNEQELFRISAANVEQYSHQLSPGQVALLKRYPKTYYYPVYPSHRIATYPQQVLEQVKASARKADMLPGGNGLVELNASTIPFPFPRQALEVIWNHITRYRGGSVERTYTKMAVQANGSYSPVLFRDELVFASSLPAGEVDNNTLFLYLSRILGPARLEGDVTLVHEYIDQLEQPRNAWLYNAGQRRVRRAPNLSYDGPGTASDGLSTMDDLDSYNGSPDRYEWNLLGKREMYIGANTYRLHSKQLKYDELILPGHINPQHTRYELRRVWVVEATLKKGARHIYARRVFYVDEDTWGVVIKDQYDGRGELWRVGQAHTLFHYDAKVPWGSDVLSDLVSGRYLVTGLDNEVQGHGYIWGKEAKASDFTPSALRRAGRR